MQRKPLILGSLLLAAFAINLDTTIVNVALPALVRELHASTTELEWIVDAYNLLFAALVLAAGNLGDGVPDGICVVAEDAVWYGDVPNERCVRVREGGDVLQTVELDRGCFACALGGADRQTLFMLATVWRGPENMFEGPRTGQVLTTPAPAQRAGWP